MPRHYIEALLSGYKLNRFSWLERPIHGPCAIQEQDAVLVGKLGRSMGKEQAHQPGINPRQDQRCHLDPSGQGHSFRRFWKMIH